MSARDELDQAHRTLLGGWTQHGHPIPGMVQDPDARPRTVARCGGPRLCQKCAREAAVLPTTPVDPQEPAGGPEVPRGVQPHLEAAGEALAAALAPMVAMIAEWDEVLGRLVPQLLALQTSLGNVLAWMERAGIRPNWATDVRTLEEARALLASLSPKEDDAEANRPS